MSPWQQESEQSLTWQQSISLSYVMQWLTNCFLILTDMSGYDKSTKESGYASQGSNTVNVSVPFCPLGFSVKERNFAPSGITRKEVTKCLHWRKIPVCVYDWICHQDFVAISRVITSHPFQNLFNGVKNSY